MDINFAHGIVGSYIFGSIKLRLSVKIISKKKPKSCLIENSIKHDFGGNIVYNYYLICPLIFPPGEKLECTFM